MITALRMLGFKKVFDTNFAADLTIMEEATELVSRLKEGKNLPLITSCCPGWIKFIETQYPELLNLPSSCKSPQEMFGAIAKTYFAEKEGIKQEDMVVVSLMPCIAKKDECNREELLIDNNIKETDYSISVKEFAGMLRRYGIDLESLPESEFDSPLGESTGAADIFANTGGVMEAVARTASKWLTGEVKNVDFECVRGLSGTREATLKLNDLTLKLCVVSGLGNARKVLEGIKSGELHYDAIEVMACPGGCVNGGGQPLHKDMEQIDVIKARQAGMYNIDKNKQVRISCDNEAIQKLYAEFLGQPNSHKAHELLHTTYKNRKD